MNSVEIKNVTIVYRTVMPFNLKQGLKNLRSFSRVKKFEAIKNVTFEIPKGSIVGLVGRNGSGKSTLLRAIAGIYSPDTGTIESFNNSVSLLAMGVGFKRELSGRENIYISGLLTGFSKKEIDEKFDEIVRFAELEDYIDMPVSKYSSGMYSKLAFSIAVNFKPDILLIDEALSVGDIRFRQKSYKKMREVIEDNDRTVVLVSHNSGTIRELCDFVVWIDNGELKMKGPTAEVMAEYERFMKG